MKFEARGSTDSANYLRMKDKESVKGALVGDLYTFKTHWAGNQSELCSEDNLCPKCATGDKPKFRFRVNFIVKGESGYEAKIFEQGWTVYEALRALHEGEYDLEKHLVTISRSGSGKNDTVYTITPAKNGEITPKLAAELVKVQLIDLKHKKEEAKKETKDKDFVPEPVFNSDEEIPF